MQFWKNEFNIGRRVFGASVLSITLLFMLVAPIFVGTYYLRMLELIGIYILFATGFNLVSGYAGQISLGHSALYAVGAYTSALVSLRLELPFWWALPIAILVTGGFGVVLGIPALRVRGPYLALVTIGFLIVLEKVLVEWVSFTGGPIGINDIAAPKIGSLVFTGKTMYYLILLVVILGLLMARNIIKGKWGRAFISLRENELASEAMGVDTRKFKIIAFVLSAMYAGAAGSLYAHLSGYISPDTFNIHLSIFILLAIIIGGKGTLIGPVIGAAGLTILPELLNDFDKYKLLVYGCLLILSVLAMRDGIAGVVSRLLTFVFGPEVLPHFDRVKTAPGLVFSTAHDQGGTLLLELKDLSKSFGGLIAVDKLSLQVNSGTIHALIGPNGAGKTTVINLISGFYRPTVGKVFFRDNNITTLQNHQRSVKGIARTFQNVQLFRKMSVLENVLVGRHTHIKGNLLSVALKMPWLRKQEAEARQKAMDLLDFFGLAGCAYEPAGKLSYGHQRLLEIARALAVEPKLLLLDEPAAGLSETEVIELESLILKIKETGITILLIEHHMNLVMKISDVVTVLDYGKKLAEGSPESVQDNDLVIQAYLGTEVA